MIKKIIKQALASLKIKVVYFLNFKEIKEFQNKLDVKAKSHKIIALVMSTSGQQQFFEDVYNLSIIECKHYHLFFVNECTVHEADKIGVFKSHSFITYDIYQFITGVDLALHTEISCRSPNVIDVCYIGHGFPGKHTVWQEEDLLSFNHYFLYGPRDRGILSLASKDSADCTAHIKFLEIGYPKYDSQINDTDPKEVTIKNLELDPNLKTILFAPAWDPGGALRTYGDTLFECFAGMHEYNVVIKLHPASLTRDNSKQYEFYTGGVNWLEILDELCQKHDNIYLSKEHKINPLFKVADVLVTDFSGVAMGFFLEDKPVICIDCPEYFNVILPSWGQDGEMSKSNDLFNNGRNASYIVEDICSLEDTVRHAIENSDELSKKRKKIASDLLYHPGKGAKYSLKAIEEILSKE